MSEITILKVQLGYGEMINIIYPVVLKSEKEMVLIDCGYPGSLPKFKEAALTQGVNLDDMTKVIITHHDYDHMGALAEIKSTYPQVQVLAHANEVPYIQGEKGSLRLQQAEGMYDFLPEDQKEGARALQQMFASVSPARVDAFLNDGDRLPWCGGVEVIATPGHMPGHISLYLKKYRTLISGDALAIQGGMLGIANPEYTLDMEGAKQSVRRLAEYDIDKIICYHGGIFDHEVKENLQRIGME